MRKKLLMYVHYYYPDVASTAQIYTDLCKGLKDKFDITVICTVPSYSGSIDEKYKDKKYYFEQLDGINVIRVRVPEFYKGNKLSRIKNIFAYYFNSMLATLKVGKQDVVFAVSQPPVLGGMLGVWGKNRTGAKLVYNIQDFNPEQTMAIKYMGTGAVHKLMLIMDKRSCRKSDMVITVGRDMQQTLINRFNGKNVPNNIVINNWIDENEVYPLDKNHPKIVEFKRKYNLENKFVIMYSGNIGLYYDLENLVRLFSQYQYNEDIVFAFAGDGAIKEKIKEYSVNNNLSNIVFIPYQPKEELIYSLNAADVHLVTNARGIKGISVPSKIYGVMSANIPVIGILEKDSEAWKIIEDSECGVLAETGKYNEIAEVLDKIIEEKFDFVKKYSKGREYIVKRYTKDKSIKQYSDALEEL